MRIPLSVRFKALFARDKNAFWWKHFTDEERELLSMDAWQLARVIHEADVRKNNHEKRIVAEHLLNVRLANIQASASKVSGWLSAFGAVLASVASFYLGQVSANKSTEAVAAHNHTTEQQPINEPVKPASRQVTPSTENKRAAPIVVAVPAKKEAVNRDDGKREKEPQTPVVKP